LARRKAAVGELPVLAGNVSSDRQVNAITIPTDRFWAASPPGQPSVSDPEPT